jgi:hypothetical protein
MYVDWFNHQAPKEIMALMSQCLEAASNMLYCFNLLPAESTGRIPFKQTHGMLVLSHRSVPSESRNYHFELMPA